METSLRKMVEVSEPVVDIAAVDDQWTIKTCAENLGEFCLTFKLDEEFEHDTPDGRHVKVSQSKYLTISIFINLLVDRVWSR
jgi:hypothetical protein